MSDTATSLPASLISAIETFRPSAPAATVEATAGRCVQINAAFADLCFSMGLDAFLSEPFDPDQFFDYGDRTIRGLATHSVIIVDTADGVFYVDWAAAQYGYTQTPKISVEGS